MLQKQVILFKIKHKPCDTDLRLKVSRKRLYKTKYLRYLGIKIDENLNWKVHIHDLASKLSRANLKIHLFCYIPFSLELCMHCLGTYKISSTKSVFSKKSTRNYEFCAF